MRRVPLALKNLLAHYLQRTKQREKVIVTERGKPAALLQPLKTAHHAASIDARLSRLATLGLNPSHSTNPSKAETDKIFRAARFESRSRRSTLM